jgi:hypothetical protein
MKRFLAVILTPFVGYAVTFAAEFSDVLIDDAFKGYLEAEPLLMEIPGAKIFVLPEGKCVMVSVASVPVVDGSPRERLRNELACKNKAMAYCIAERDGVTVTHVETSIDEDRIELRDETETVTSISRFLGITQSKVSGVLKGMRVVGRWKSADGSVFYLAMGAVVDCNCGDSAPLSPR